MGNDPLVARYGESGTMERFHADVANTFLVAQMKAGALRGLPEATKAMILKLVTDLILATDMGQHQTLMTETRALISSDRYTSALAAAAGSAEAATDAPATDESDRLALLSAEDSATLAKYLLKCADISNIARPFSTSRVWAQRLKREFSEQGRLEQAHGLEVSPLNNVNDVRSAGADTDADSISFAPGVVPSMVMGFCQFLGNDAFELLAACFTADGFPARALAQLKENRAMWVLTRDVELAADLIRTRAAAEGPGAFRRSTSCKLDIRRKSDPRTSTTRSKRDALRVPEQTGVGAWPSPRARANARRASCPPSMGLQLQQLQVLSPAVAAC